MSVSRRNTSEEHQSSSASRAASETRARVRRDESVQRAPSDVAAAATSTVGVAIGDVCATDSKVDESETSLGHGGGEPSDAERNPRQEIAVQWFTATLCSALAIQYRSVPSAGALPGADWSVRSSAGAYATIGRVELAEPASDGGLAERDGSGAPSSAGDRGTDDNDDERDEDAGFDDADDRGSVRQWRRSSYNGIRTDSRNHQLYEPVRKTASDDEDAGCDHGGYPAGQDYGSSDRARGTPVAAAAAASRGPGRDLHAQRAVVLDRPRGRDRPARSAGATTAASSSARR
mgnify:CR=1 FL=1